VKNPKDVEQTDESARMEINAKTDDIELIKHINKSKFKSVKAQIDCHLKSELVPNHLPAYLMRKNRHKVDVKNTETKPVSAAVMAVFHSESEFNEFRQRYAKPMTFGPAPNNDEMTVDSIHKQLGVRKDKYNNMLQTIKNNYKRTMK
jgi:uncharacterized protein YeaO (DUF488 family)